MSFGIAPASPLFDLERAQTVPVSTSMPGCLFLFGFTGRQLVICAVTSLVLNYLRSFLAAPYPNYFSLFCRRPGILVLINDADWELMVCTPSVSLSLLKICSVCSVAALREALSDSCPRAKLLVFEGEGAGWDLSPYVVLWLFSSLEPFSNLLSLSSQPALKRDPLDSLASSNGLHASSCSQVTPRMG